MFLIYTKEFEIVQLGPNLSWGFGPKVNSKLTLETTTTTHHHNQKLLEGF